MRLRLPALLVLLAAAIRLVFHAVPSLVGWDASVYVGVAKAMVSLGQHGLWEPLRPLVWPLLLTPAVILDVNPVLYAHLLQFVFGMGVVFLGYLLAKECFGERAGIWAIAFIALAPLLAFYEHQLLTEQPAVFFALLAVYVFHKASSWKGYICAGMLAAMAFMTKFPEGLVLAALLFASMTKPIQRMLPVLAGFTIATFPFLVFNAIMYQNPLASVLAANDVIQTSGQWLYPGSWTFYFAAAITQNLFLVFAIPGLLTVRKKGSVAVAACAILVVGYLTFLAHKEIRFLPLAFPFICILAAAGWALVEKKVWRWLVLILVAVWCVQALWWGITYFNYEERPVPAVTELYAAVGAGSAIVSSDPRVALFTDTKIEPLYYPLFPQNLSLGLAALEGKDTLLWNSCDTPCAPDDAQCRENVALFEKELLSWQRHESVRRGECTMTRFTRS